MTWGRRKTFVCAGVLMYFSLLFRLPRSKMDGSFDCDCGELEPPDH